MQNSKFQSENEILEISDSLVLVNTQKINCLEKVKQLCRNISLYTPYLAYFYINHETDYIAIYTKKENKEKAKHIINIFEANYSLALRKRNSIVNHKHKFN